ncbi:MAG: alpha/beta hydrolase [Fimbriimonas sp.]
MSYLAREKPESPFPIFLLHGLGSNEGDLFYLGKELSDVHSLTSLRAPFTFPPGYAWFHIDWTPIGIEMDAVEAATSKDLIIARLERAKTPVVLAGFSQGAMMALWVAWTRPDLVRGVLLMSGRLLPVLEREAPNPDFLKVPIFVSHGLLDEVIPRADARKMIARLKEVGAEPTVVEFAMGHTVNEEAILAAREWLATLS